MSKYLFLFLVAVLSIPNNGHAATKDVLKTDFLINDDTTGGNQGQNCPSVSMDSVGNFVVVWIDNRNGYYGDIFAQIYNRNRTPKTQEFRVIDYPPGTYKEYPSVAMSPTGRFVVVWQDRRNGIDVYAQIYDSSGIPQGGNFRVNDVPGTGYISKPKVSMDKEGNFVVVWCNHSSSNYDIYAKRYNFSGVSLGTNFKVNNNTGTSEQSYPAITVHKDGGFIITWQYSYFIYAQIYNSSGAPVGANFRVNDDISGKAHRYPCITIDRFGNFIIVWLDNRVGTSYDDIYAQAYNSSGTPQGANFKINNNTPGTAYPWNNCFTGVAIDSVGNFFVIWQDIRSTTGTDIYTRRCKFPNTPQDTDFKVNEISLNCGYNNYPSIAASEGGKFVAIWMDVRGGMYAQMYDTAGTPQEDNFKIECEKGAGNQETPSVAMNESGVSIVGWVDCRNENATDIYAQYFNSSGNPIDTNFRVNNTTGAGCYNTSASVCINKKGNAVIVWTGGYDLNAIYARRYAPYGVPQDTNFLVWQGDSSLSAPSVAMDSTGNFVVTWVYRLDGNVYAKMYNSSGIFVSTFKVNNNAYYTYSSPSIAMAPGGDFVVSWSTYNVYIQRYTPSGTPKDTNIMVSDSCYYSPSVAMDSIGNFVVIWSTYTKDIYARMYDSSGTPQGSKFKVNSDSTRTYYSYPSVTMDKSGKSFVVVWTAIGADNDPDIMAQAYKNGNPVDFNKQINYDSLYYFSQQTGRPSVACNSEKVFFVWQDNRRNKGWDIYGKLTDLTLIPVQENTTVSKLQLAISQNPFSHSTVITYQLPQLSSAAGGLSPMPFTLCIYDLSGRCVKTLINEPKPAGSYSISLSANDLKTGIYFVRLAAGNYKETKKLILMK